MWRVLKNKKEFFLSNPRGYTLTELVVVMGIIGLLVAITFGGYEFTRREKYVQHVANLTQTNIRNVFIDIISTKVESSMGACNNLPPQIKALRIQLGTSVASPISKVSLCNTSSGVLSTPDVVETPDPSSGINYERNLMVGFNTPYIPGGAYESEVNSGYLYLIFTSPNGKFYSFYSGATNAGLADAEFKTLGWSNTNPDQTYVPGSATNEGYMIIYFRSNSQDEHKVYITEQGNAQLVF